MAVHQRSPSNLTELERICKEEEWQRIPKSRAWWHRARKKKKSINAALRFQPWSIETHLVVNRDIALVSLTSLTFAGFSVSLPLSASQKYLQHKDHIVSLTIRVSHGKRVTGQTKSGSQAHHGERKNKDRYVASPRIGVTRGPTLEPGLGNGVGAAARR
ncbi:hypothetical protein L3Q82_004478 [Scortum barcoo]|uniref:Uncharacterized protein n=1 Tax=Scortum barcoo TaxID=214431 RepID=A0ACB8VKC7_9TELE|nr:hypothetical protein L3Q82_004478 [Scortum barcoo]